MYPVLPRTPSPHLKTTAPLHTPYPNHGLHQSPAQHSPQFSFNPPKLLTRAGSQTHSVQMYNTVRIGVLFSARATSIRRWEGAGSITKSDSLFLLVGANSRGENGRLDILPFCSPSQKDNRRTGRAATAGFRARGEVAQCRVLQRSTHAACQYPFPQMGSLARTMH